ncbi:MAG TPA: hypothetical protein VF593_10605 [Chthoniobacteraceae bacterium]
MTRLVSLHYFSPRCFRFLPHSAVLSAGLMLLTFSSGRLRAEGLYHGGATARSAALGGNDTATAAGPLDALASNPATLSNLRGPTLEITGAAGFLRGEYRNRAGGRSSLEESGVIPRGAVGAKWGPLAFGLGVDRRRRSGRSGVTRICPAASAEPAATASARIAARSSCSARRRALRGRSRRS